MFRKTRAIFPVRRWSTVEIVVPIFMKHKLAAELDIESYFAGTFTKSEQEFVEACAALVAKHLSKG